MFPAGTTAKGGSAPGPLVSVIPASAFCSDVGAVDVGIRFLRNGTVEVLDNCGGYAYDQDYLASGLPDATIGDNYEVMLTVNTTAPTSGSLINTWHQLNVTHTFGWEGFATFDSGDWNFFIREIAVPANADDDDFEWDVEDGS